MNWGRDELEWAELIDVTASFLAERARLTRTTSYTELNTVLTQRADALAFDFSTDGGRAAMGALLGEVARVKHAEVGALVSSIVVYLNGNDAGSGSFRALQDRGCSWGLNPPVSRRDRAT